MPEDLFLTTARSSFRKKSCCRASSPARPAASARQHHQRKLSIDAHHLRPIQSFCSPSSQQLRPDNVGHHGAREGFSFGVRLQQPDLRGFGEFLPFFLGAESGIGIVKPWDGREHLEGGSAGCAHEQLRLQRLEGRSHQGLQQCARIPSLSCIRYGIARAASIQLCSLVWSQQGMWEEWRSVAIESSICRMAADSGFLDLHARKSRQRGAIEC